jgi:dienelactone hydrolase
VTKRSLSQGVSMGLEGFREKAFTYDGTTRAVYRSGAGPGVVVMHEIPGIHPGMISFAERLAAAGFSVAMPVMFGMPGRPVSTGYILRELVHVCVSREFRLLAAHRSSPITDWLRALCRSLHAELGGKGVGAIGMCLTGNFALALMVDEVVMAPVLSQPSLPFPFGKDRRAGLHLSDQDLAVAKGRRVPVLGLRFTGDSACPVERFDRLRAEFGDCFEAIEIDSSKGNAFGIPPDAHSVLTLHFVDHDGHPTRMALDRTIEFFRARLRGP